MKNLLRIDSSVQMEGSVSKMLADEFEGSWQTKYPGGTIVSHDLGQNPINHIDATFIYSSFTPVSDRTSDQVKALESSDHFIEELRNADHLLISVPMYNFSIPSSLKAYFDHIARAGETFQYTEQGPQGLLTNVKATLILASGGDYTQPPMDQMDFCCSLHQNHFRFSRG